MKFNETTLTCLKLTSLIIQKYQKTEIYYDHNEHAVFTRLHDLVFARSIVN